MSWSTVARARTSFHLKSIPQNHPLQSRANSYKTTSTSHYWPSFGSYNRIPRPRCEFNTSPIGHWHGNGCIKKNFSTYNASSTEQKSRKTLIYLTGLVIAMVGSSYAAVPLYRRFCQATGYGGTIQRRESVEEKIVRHSKEGTVTTREIVVQLMLDVADGMPWKFFPTQREVRRKPGESALAFYTAENRSSTPITGVSTYNVNPNERLGFFFFFDSM
ncbi:LOW QUALITY PROTEIN: cytochrome c oxidase assembly protein COX11, mitochondrial [Jatropha curcas]|uniref:LOW QUALITY PROTEIN: cytochrome c oxidase assembly protein COX11, mitochondrial n=1 Tax=Jatropha curcas TaxID=180498 RepID=UPI001892E2F4|nr:LOW QUALITY PROTEIN: cytochrome c oxidase assembly protein COX11, mitochondrial [Jatropha curcas]